MSKVDLPNIREPFLSANGQISRPWWIWLQQLMTRIGGSNPGDITALQEAVRQLIKDVLSLERVAADESTGQLIAELNLMVEGLSGLQAGENFGHGQWEDPEMHAAATASAAGFLSAADKAKLDGISATAEDKFVSGTDFTPGVTTSLTLSKSYASAAAVLVHFDGTFQGSDQYAIGGTTITFTSAIPVGVSTVYARG